MNDMVEKDIFLQPPVDAPLDVLHDEAEEFKELPEFIEDEDGSVIIPDIEDINKQEFDDNLAEYLPESVLEDIANTLLEDIDRDKEARKKRDEQYEEGLRRTGLGDDAPGGAQFSGASKVVHPVLAESCVDFAARAIKELFPANGPVRMDSDSELDPMMEQQAQNLRRCLNDQFTRRIPEYRSVFEQKLTQLPLGGSQFTKFYYDSTKMRICSEFVPIDNIFIPFYAASFYDADRTTHRQYLSRRAFESRIDSGLYRDTKVIDAIDPERSASAVANDKIEGKVQSGYNADGERIVYETYVWLELEDDNLSAGARSPYIVSIDENDQRIVSIYRNWDEEDPTRQKLDWIIDDTFIPWRGAYGIGFPHLIGGLSGAATGALRALLDSAHINNAPTLVKLKGSRFSGQTQQVQVTQIAEIEGPVGVDDIRKFIMPMPFNAPSGVLFQLLGWLTDAAKGVVSTASEKIADATSNTPVGTTQALIEQGAIIFSSIHARLHFSQTRAFEVVYRLLRQYMPGVLQEYGVDPSFVDLKAVQPVSDPHIFSEAQRYAQIQGALQLSSAEPTLPYNKIELHRSMLALMKIKNIDRILPPPPPPPQPADPALELINFIQDKPVKCVPDQDHFSHIVVHMNYLRDPMCGKNPVMVPITTKLLEHLREHIGYFFAHRLMTAATLSAEQNQQQNQMLQAQGLPENPQIPPETAMAQASGQILQTDMEYATEALRVIEDVTEFLRIQGPQDAASAALKMQAEIDQMDVQRLREKDAVEASIKQQALEYDHELDALKQQLAERSQLFEQQLKEKEYQLDAHSQKADILAREHANRMQQLTELLKNQDDNRTKYITEQIKAGIKAAVDLKTSEMTQAGRIDTLSKEN